MQNSKTQRCNMYLDRLLIRQVDAYAKSESMSRTQAFTALVRLGLVADLEGLQTALEKEEKIDKELGEIQRLLRVNAYWIDVVQSGQLRQAVMQGLVDQEEVDVFFRKSRIFANKQLKKLKNKPQENG